MGNCGRCVSRARSPPYSAPDPTERGKDFFRCNEAHQKIFCEPREEGVEGGREGGSEGGAGKRKARKMRGGNIHLARGYQKKSLLRLQEKSVGEHLFHIPVCSGCCCAAAAAAITRACRMFARACESLRLRLGVCSV